MGIWNQGRGVKEKYQGKDREGGGPVSLNNRKYEHKNSSYWDQVDWVAALAPNEGTIPQWLCCISDSDKPPDNEDRYGNLDHS